MCGSSFLVRDFIKGDHTVSSPWIVAAAFGTGHCSSKSSDVRKTMGRSNFSDTSGMFSAVGTAHR